MGKKLTQAGKIYGKCFQVRVDMVLFQLAVLMQFYLSNSPLKKKFLAHAKHPLNPKPFGLAASLDFGEDSWRRQALQAWPAVLRARMCYKINATTSSPQ